MPRSDVLVENFGPGAHRSPSGFGYAALAKINPRLNLRHTSGLRHYGLKRIQEFDAGRPGQWAGAMT